MYKIGLQLSFFKIYHNDIKLDNLMAKTFQVKGKREFQIYLIDIDSISD